jgi:hypothetical protein
MLRMEFEEDLMNNMHEILSSDLICSKLRELIREEALYYIHEQSRLSSQNFQSEVRNKLISGKIP